MRLETQQRIYFLALYPGAWKEEPRYKARVLQVGAQSMPKILFGYTLILWGHTYFDHLLSR